MNLYVSKQIQDGVTIHPDFVSLWLFKAAVINEEWDSLFIELSNDMPRNVLKQISGKFNHIAVQLPEDITHYTVNLLCELYPSKESNIRKSFYTGEGVENVLLRNLWRDGDKA